MTDKYIISICGTHGTGKSTVMRGLDELNLPIANAQLSRAAQKYLGWDSLIEAEKSEDNMWLLQDAIVSLMYDRDKTICDSRCLSFVERSPADLWAYTKLWCKRLNVDLNSNRVIKYKNLLRTMSEKYACFMVLFPTPHIPFQAEKNRADIESRQEVQEDIIRFLTSGNLKYEPVPVYNKDARINLCASIFTIIKAQQIN